MYFSDIDSQQLGTIPRLNLINAVTGVKPAKLIGTISANGVLRFMIHEQ